MGQEKRGKKYSDEFRAEAVELSEDIGCKEAAKQLGIGFSTINKWRAALKDGKFKSNQEKRSYAELEAENRKLKKEIGYIKQINDVLKKSTAIFSKDHLGDSK